MIILPDKNIPRSKVLLPVLKKEWMIPSLAQPKDQFGKENRTYFSIKAFTNDGKVCWCGIYEDREDFDAVLWAIATDTLKYEKALWPLSTPSWEPWLGEIITYQFATYAIKTSPTGSNQTYDKPSDWDNNNNKIECIGAGASGGAGANWFLYQNCTGGGGGAYSKISNFSFSGSSATYQIGTGGTAVATPTGGSSGNAPGNNGGNTWFNATSDPGNGTDNTKCSSEGGKGGLSGQQNTIVNGGAGGATTASWGETKYAGGRGGNATTQQSRFGSGGGGAGGSTGVGNNGIDGTSGGSSQLSTAGGNGGAGDSGIGAAGTGGSAAAAAGSFGQTGGTGGNGTNLANATVGTGGGGGGCYDAKNEAATAGTGGNYGAGGGGCSNLGSGNNSATKSTSGEGIGGLIIITYTPAVNNGKFLLLFN